MSWRSFVARHNAVDVCANRCHGFVNVWVWKEFGNNVFEEEEYRVWQKEEAPNRDECVDKP